MDGKYSIMLLSSSEFTEQIFVKYIVLPDVILADESVIC